MARVNFYLSPLSAPLLPSLSVPHSLTLALVPHFTLSLCPHLITFSIYLTRSEPDLGGRYYGSFSYLVLLYFLFVIYLDFILLRSPIDFF